MLNSFRTLAGSVWAKILLIFLVLSFGVWGIGDMLRNPDRNVAVATVGSSVITREQFVRALHRETESVRNSLGDQYSPELMKSMNFPHSVLQNMISHKLVQLESQAIGLLPSDADVVHRIRANPSFSDKQGAFDKKTFEMALKNANMSESAYVEQLRQDMGVALLLDTLLAATPVPDIEVKTLLDSQEQGRSIRLYNLTSKAVGALPQPDEAQVKAYYDSHNHEFTAPEYRNISYATISSAAVHDMPALSEDALRVAYQERIDEFKHAERRTVEQLLFSSKEKAVKAEDVLKDGKKFENVAKEADILNKNATSMGKVEKNGVIESAADAVFALKAGEYTAPIQSPFGWHIFYVSAIEPPATSPFEEVRPMLEKELKLHQSDDALNKLAVKVEDALAGGSTLQEATQDVGLKIVTVGPVNHEGQSPDGTKLKDVPDYDKFLDTAFKTDDKNDSSMMTSKGGIFYVLHVDSIVPERLRSLDEVRGLVVAGWQKEESAKRLSAIAKEIGPKFLNASDRDAMIEKYHPLPVATDIIKHDTHAIKDTPLPPELVSDVFTRKIQEGTKAYPLQNGSYVLAIVDSVVPAPNPEGNAKLTSALHDIHQHVEATVQNELMEQYTHYLTSKYTVSINDSVFQSVSQ